MRIPSYLLSSLLLAACGIQHKVEVKGSLDNRSDYPAVLSLELSESSVEDDCSPDTSSRSKKVDVAPHEKESATLTWSCAYDVYQHVSYNLNRGVEPGKPSIKQAAYGIGSHLTSPLAPGDEVFWLDADGEAHAATISDAAYYEMGQDQDLPDTEALLKDPVRTDGRVLEMFYSPDGEVTALGVDAQRFKPTAPNDVVNHYVNERDGVNYFKVYGHGVTGALSGDYKGKEAHIVCTNDGCRFE